MSTVYLYEFEFVGAQPQRLVQGTSIQAEGYTWRGVSSISDLELRLSVVDENFAYWVSDRSVDKVFVSKYEYDTENETVEGMTRNLYSLVDVSTSSVSFRKSDIPEEHLIDAQKLLADGIVQLYEIKLADNSYIHLKADNSVNWNGSDWMGIPVLFEGYSTAQGDSYARPTLSVANPDYVNPNDGNARSSLSALVLPTRNESTGKEYPFGLLDRAIVNRYTVLYDDLINNRKIFQKKTWIAWYVKTVNKNLIQIELRNPMDGVNFDVPARMFIPPEFPFVTLK